MTLLLLGQAQVVILFVVICAILMACHTASDEEHLPSGAPATLDRPALDGPPVSVQYVLENPSAYVDKRVTLGGEIVDVWSPHAFTIIGHQFLANDTLLVVTRDNMSALAASKTSVGLAGAIVRVTGEVTLAGIEAAERKLGIDVSEAAQSLARVRRPVFIAERVVFVPRPSGPSSPQGGPR